MKAFVRRGSLHRDALKGFFQSFDPKQKGPILKAAERYDNITKPAGKRNGALGYTGIKVLKVLLDLIDYRTGRLEPSYLSLCERARLSVNAISEALKRLVLHGFIELRRRYEPTGNVGSGPTVRQITNAYRIMLPELAAKTLRLPPVAPVSDDELSRRKEQRDERERMICQLPEWEQPVARANVQDDDLVTILNRMARTIFARENWLPDRDSTL
ncbi:MAG: RNA replicase [Sphingopyxis sp.]|nr:RNA replicase [Sphingopyxis sp.]